MRAAWHGDTLVGVQFNNDRPMDRRYRLVRRATPGVVEHNYQVWTMPASDSQYATVVDTTTLMPARDGAKLETYIVRPVGPGPFGVVMQRSPYRATNPGPGTLVGFARLHLRGAAGAGTRQVQRRCRGLRRLQHRHPGWLRRGRVGGAPARRQRQGRDDRPFGRGAAGLVSRR